MSRFFWSIVLTISLQAVTAVEAASGRVVKVLPHFLDLQGRHSLTPSLYDRDAYQAQLRKHPDQRSGLRFDVQWRARGAKSLRLAAELRGVVKGSLPLAKKLEASLEPGRRTSGWASLALSGEDYKTFGEVTAWRVTLWDGDHLLGEQKSFLW